MTNKNKHLKQTRSHFYLTKLINNKIINKINRIAGLHINDHKKV